MKKLIGIFATIFSLVILMSKPALAQQYGQYGQYGQPAPSQQILVEKLVSAPGSTKGGQVNFVDNLSPSDARFVPGDTILFKLKVKNTSDTKLTNVVVEDFLPSSIDLTEGSASIKVGDLAAGEEKEFTLKARAKDQAKLPADRGLICEVNRVRATSNGVSDEDTAQFCIEKQVTPVKQVPQAGPEAGVILLGFNLLSLGTGLALSKYRKRD